MRKAHKPLLPEEKLLLNEYLASLEMHPHNTPRLFAIGFLGLPGSGKSTLADILGSRLHLPINRSDQIRRFLNRKGFPGAHPRPDILATLAEERTLFFYKNATSAIIDANFTEYAAVSRAGATTHGATLLLVRVVCPDAVAVERLKHRRHTDSSASAASAEDYPRIKALVATFPPINDPYATIDTTKPLEPQVDELHKKLIDDEFIVAPH